MANERILRRFVFSLYVSAVYVLAPGCVLQRWPFATASGDDYAVYAAAIDEMDIAEWGPASLESDPRPIKLVVIEDTTSYAPGFGDDSELSAYVRKECPSISQALLEELRHFNTTDQPLRERFQTPFRVQFVSRAEIADIFRDFLGHQGWAEFYRRYPHSQGILSLSRVAFDHSEDRALVYVGNQRHWLNGRGVLVLLKRDATGWKVEQKVLLWIS